MISASINRFRELPYLPPVLPYLMSNPNTCFPWTLAQLARGIPAGLASQANPSLKRNRVPRSLPSAPAPMTCRPPAPPPLHVYRKSTVPYPPAFGAIPQR